MYVYLHVPANKRIIQTNAHIYKILMNTAEKIPITKDNAKRGVAICPR